MSAYELVYQFILIVDEQIERGYHLRDCDGRLLRTLDEVVRAIEAGRWA